jgi:hypothetical protein
MVLGGRMWGELSKAPSVTGDVSMNTRGKPIIMCRGVPPAWPLRPCFSPGLCHNLENHLLVVEGEFDALAVDGVAVLHNDISPKQAQLIADLDVEPIVVPDKDRSGTKLAERAIELGWSVAFPDWDNGIKDCADASKAYGRVVTLNSIIQSRQDNPLKIKIMLRKN